jgi:hypothetical protein
MIALRVMYGNATHCHNWTKKNSGGPGLNHKPYVVVGGAGVGSAD